MTQVLGPDTPIGPLVRSLQRQGVEVHVVEAGADKADSLTRFGDTLGFPDWYGHNLDALYDCLLDLVAAAESPVHLVWDGTAQLRAEHPDAFASVVAVLDDAETEAGQGSFSATVVDR